MTGSSPQGALWSDPKVVLSLPLSYPKQEGLSCGETNARSVVESFGHVYQRPTRVGLLVRLFGYSLLKSLEKLFESHGVSAPIRSAAGLDDAEKLDLLRSHLETGYPVVIAIGNGHLRRGEYFPAARLILGHYLTIYGFDDPNQTFFVYDSYLDGEPDSGLPVGNETRTYSEILRDWRGPIYYPLIGRRYVFIPATPRDKQEAY
ncbi:MAG: BtrH N-terminal domain-containing protein [Actinomycetota bacterium]|nr:BtrH N-terminal domain-containing protein [Actinomycetota bacterium]